jgi:hypothetical protein
MANDFLDGIDEAFQKLMKLNGNGKRNGSSMGRSSEDRLTMEIVNCLQNLSINQKEEVLKFIASLEQPKVD